MFILSNTTEIITRKFHKARKPFIEQRRNATIAVVTQQHQQILHTAVVF